MVEKVARLDKEQWDTLKAVLDGEIADLQRQLKEAQVGRGIARQTATRLGAERDAVREELSAWHQEFTVTVNGKPYTMDPIEAGKMVQDAEAEARMATQDKEAAERDAATQRTLLAEHHRDNTGMWKWCPVCGATLTPAEEEAPHYNEDGEEILETQWQDLQAKQQAEDNLANRDTDMPRYDGD